MKAAAIFLIVGLPSAWALNISFPMRFVSVVDSQFTRNYYRTTTAGPVPSTIVVELEDFELVFSDRELARAHNEPIKSIFLRSAEPFAAFEITRLGLRAARSSYLRHSDNFGHSWSYLTSHKAYLEPPRKVIIDYLDNISALGIWPVEFVITTASLKEYSLTFHNLIDLKNFLGLGESLVRTGPKPNFCEKALSMPLLRNGASSKPYLRLVQ